MFRSRPALAALAAAAAVALAGCPSKHTTFTGALKYGKTAEENYQNGLDELKAENWVEASKFFEHVRLKYPFSKYAALSELRIADVKFANDRFLEAADAYAAFAQLHPTSEEVDYAEFRSGVAHLRDAPSDFALFPPSWEKDQRQVKKAVEILDDFVKTKSTSKYNAEARKLLAEARGRLAAHEWYVGEYYYKRKRWAGAAGRYETLVDKYPGSTYEPEALMKLAEACIQIKENFRARTALQKLIVTHPQDPRRPQAEKLLASLR
jgi:outer membrane protein assembly factor BamD